MKEIQNGKVLTAAQKVSLPPSEQEKYRLDDGDILLNRTNSLDLVGKSGVYHQNTIAVFASYLIRLKPVKSLADSDYLGYYLNSYPAYITLKKIATAAISQANINPTELKRLMVIPCPPLLEQQQIAEFLGTWDEAIEKLERLIEAKEKRLSWIRANILTGKVRLKNHYANWKLQHLASILDEHKEKSSGQELVHSVSVHKGVVNQIEHLGRNFAAKDTSNYNLAKPGDIIYTKSPTGDFPYGIIKLNQNDYNVIVSPLYGVFTPKWPELGIWLDCYFEASQNAINYLHPIIQKGAKNTINITNKTFLSNVLLLPTEQNEVQEICQIISNIKAELVLLTQELDAFQKQKRGLMQKLLTGTWRV